MNDLQIIEMYWKRNEQAISVTAEKYGTYCYSIAYGILHNEEDSKESVADFFRKMAETLDLIIHL